MTSHILLMFVHICIAANFVQSSEPTDDLKDDHEIVIRDGVTIEYLHKKENCERLTKTGDEVHMHYTGTLTDGKQFDSSVGGEPLKFRLGEGHAIQGWEEGLLEMCVGEKRKLTIPPSKGYGNKGAGESIPPDSTLVFEVELMKISDEEELGGDQPPRDQPMLSEDQSFESFFIAMDTDKDGHVTKDEFTVHIRETEEGIGHDTTSAERDLKMIDQIFAQEDKNKDGCITMDEFLSDKYDEHDEL